jgi:transcriptional regulator with XRE-family HTH domain
VISIFTYLSFRAFLRDAYKARKAASPAFSYRFVAQRLGINARTFVRILQGKRNLTQKMVAPVAAVFMLGKQESTFFGPLVNLDQDRNEQEKRLLYTRPLTKKENSYQFAGNENRCFFASSSIHGYSGRRFSIGWKRWIKYASKVPLSILAQSVMLLYRRERNIPLRREEKQFHLLTGKGNQYDEDKRKYGRSRHMPFRWAVRYLC